MSDSNPVIDCLMNHRSIRRFTSDAIPEETIETILKAGVRAATAGGIQPYKLIVIDDPELQKKVSYVPGPLSIVSVVDQHRVKRYYELNDAPFYNDQAINLMISFWDATIALHNVVIAAESLGLGGVYIGMILSQNIGELLGAPKYVVPAGLVTLGFPDEDPEIRPRLPLEALVCRNTYAMPSDDDIRSWYREGDEQWRERFENEWDEDRRAAMTKRGVTNRAQQWTIGHYTEEFTRREASGVLRNIKQARFRLEG